MEIDFIGESYTARSPAVDCQETINMYPEITEAATQNSKAKMVLMRCPGLKKFGPVIPSNPPTPPPPPTPVADFEIVDGYNTKWPTATTFGNGDLKVNSLSVAAISWLYELFMTVYRGVLGVVSSYAGENDVVDDVGGNTGSWSRYDNNGYLLDNSGTPKYYERGLEEFCFELDGINSAPNTMLRFPYYQNFYFSQMGKFEIDFDFNLFKAEGEGNYFWPGITFALGNPFVPNWAIVIYPEAGTEPSINDFISIFNGVDNQVHHVPLSRIEWHSLKVTYDNGRVEVYLDTVKITPDEYKNNLITGIGNDFVIRGGGLDSIALIDDIIISRGAPEFVKIYEYTVENPLMLDETIGFDVDYKLKLTINDDPALFKESDPFNKVPIG